MSGPRAVFIWLAVTVAALLLSGFCTSWGGHWEVYSHESADGSGWSIVLSWIDAPLLISLIGGFALVATLAVRSFLRRTAT